MRGGVGEKIGEFGGLWGWGGRGMWRCLEMDDAWGGGGARGGWEWGYGDRWGALGIDGGRRGEGLGGG